MYKDHRFIGLIIFCIFQQKSISSEVDKKRVKTITVDALNRLEQLSLQPKSELLVKDKLLDELEHLPSPPNVQPKGSSEAKHTSSGKTLPRGNNI